MATDQGTPLPYLAALLEHTGEGVILATADGVIAYANPTARSAIDNKLPAAGGNLNELDAHTVGQFTPLSALLSQLQTCKIWAGDMRIRDAAGDDFTAATQLKLVELDGAKYVMCFFRDVTQDRDALSEERARTARLRRTQRVVGVGGYEWLWDSDRGFCSQAMLDIIGYDL